DPSVQLPPKVRTPRRLPMMVPPNSSRTHAANARELVEPSGHSPMMSHPNSSRTQVANSRELLKPPGHLAMMVEPPGGAICPPPRCFIPSPPRPHRFYRFRCLGD